MEFRKWDKIPRLMRDIVISEKIDGTNAQVFIDQYANYDEEEWNTIGKFNLADEQGFDKFDHFIIAGSRRRYLSLESDNFGFCVWVRENAQELLSLGEGRHFGEWWGQGIQRKYDMDRKVFSLFNTHLWTDERPDCCDVVPVLWKGLFNEQAIKSIINRLSRDGSKAATRYGIYGQKAEGVVVFHTQSNHLFKVTIENDEVPKGMVK